MNPSDLTRRAFLGNAGLGFGALALNSLIGQQKGDPLAPKPIF